MSILDGTQDYIPADKYLAHTAVAGDSMSLPAEIIHGAVATLADVGTTYWNSLTPEKYNASTADLLSRIDGDALQVYNEHPDTIKALSFVTGMVAPIGLSLKGMGMLRAGSKGLSWFSEAGQAANLTRVEEAFAAGGKSAEFFAARNSMYKALALNAVADNVAAEIAIVGTLSSHPFMEDYNKDFGSNFLKSVAFGSVLQTGLGAIISKGTMAAKTGAIEKQANAIIKETIHDPIVEQGVSLRSHLNTSLGAKVQNADRLESVIARIDDPADPYTVVPFVRKMLETELIKQRGEAVDMLVTAAQGKLGEFLSTATPDVLDHFVRLASTAEAAGLDKLDFARVSGVTRKLGEGVAGNQLQETVNLVKSVIKKIKGTEKEVESLMKEDAVYLPTKNAYISKRDFNYFSTLADIGETVQSIEKGMDKRLGIHPLADWSIEAAALPTAILEKDYAEAVLWASKLSVEDFNKVVVHPDHLPAIKALYIRAQELLKDNPDAKLQVKITRAAPSFEAVQRQALAIRGGVPSTYISDLQDIANSWENYISYGWKNKRLTGIDSAVHDMLHQWTVGTTSAKNVIRAGASLSRNLLQSYHLTEGLRSAAVEYKNNLETLYSSSRSQSLRDAFRRIADADGNVWLYRGLNVDPKSHQAIESYTLTAQKAREFTKGYEHGIKMYKVHVDDIIGGTLDMGPGGTASRTAYEILAYPPTRDLAQVNRAKLNELPDELLIEMPKVVTTGVKETAVLSDPTALEKTMIETQALMVRDLQSKGFGLETIALKTGTPEETIAAILDSGRVEGAGLIKYGSREDVAAAINPMNRALAMSTDMNKNLQPAVYAKLNELQLDNTSQGIMEMVFLTSPSSFIRGLGESILSPNMKELSKNLYDGMARFTSTELKSTFFSSTNQALEAFGSTGQVANMIGKEVIRIKNEIKEAFEKPLSNLMGAIIKEGEASLIEANTAFAVNASIKGRRFYKAGSFWIPSESVTLSDLRTIMKLPDEAFQELISQTPELATKATFRGKEFNVVSQSVKDLLSLSQDYGREMYNFKNARNVALGRQELSDIGFWSPSFNPRDKSIAYVYDKIHDTTSMLYANTDPLLASSLVEYENSLLKEHGPNWRARFSIITKAQQEDYNKMVGRHDSLYMQAADLTKKHEGSSAATVVSTDTSVFRDILQGFQDHVNRGVEDLVEIQLNRSMDMMKSLSSLSTGVYSEATKGIIEKLKTRPVDLGNTIRNVVLGRPQLAEHKAWSELQQRGQVFTDMALRGISDIFTPILSPVLSKISKAQVRTNEEWNKVIQEMESRGIVNPFDSIDKELGRARYLREGQGGEMPITPRASALGNGLAATVLLRFAELGQPLVNALSLPILTSGAVGRKLDSSFMGTALNTEAKFYTSSLMYDGVRALHHPEFKKYFEIGEKKGYFAVELRNVTELLEHQRSLDPGLMTTTEKAMESSLVKVMSKPSDLSEEMVRRVSFSTGVVMAKRAYPGLSDTGVTTFARNFMDEAIGNYTAAQRPAMFQGTFGTAMGLFQTYMLTLAQQLYRGVEHRDWASLGKLLLTQSTIFGAGSLPGFHQVSEAIGKNFSDKHVDLETGTFRALSDPVATMLIYGLPSSFGPGVNTRGDIQPRLPNPVQGLDSLALYNIGKQAYSGIEKVAMAAYHTDENAGKAMLEAISLQSISRPIARLSELASGVSLTGRGDIVAKDSELYNVQGIMSRLFATRPIEEIKAREVLHLNTLYGAADSDKRKEITARLKQHIRGNDLSNEKLDLLAQEYLRSGSAQGWRAAVNDAIKQEGQSGNATTLGKLKKDSPLNRMIEDIDR